MNRRSKYHPLKYVIECDMQSFFQPIAAINSDQVAIEYAKACKGINPLIAYRVLERKGSGAFVEIWPKDQRK